MSGVSKRLNSTRLLVNRIGTSLGLIGASLLVLVSYQNCGSGFQALSELDALSNSSLRVGSGRVVGGVYQTSTGEGFSTLFMGGLLLDRYGYKYPSASNVQANSLAEIKKSLSLLDSSSLHHFREGLELRTLFPSPGRVEHLEDIVEVLKLYQNRQATVLLFFGMPFPEWMILPGKTGAWCPMPVSDADWLHLKNQMSESIGLLMERLWNHPELDQEWMRSKLLIEPFNEFDTLPTLAANGSCQSGVDTGLPTGARGAALSGGIEYYLNQRKIPLTVVMPSTVWGDESWLADYYKNGGKGQPNIHLYARYQGTDDASPASLDSYLGELMREMREHNAVVPQRYKNQFILGEFGLPNVKFDCNQSNREGRIVSGEAERQYLTKVFMNAELKRLAPVRLMWRYTDLKHPSDNPNGQTGCEGSFGVLDANFNPKPQLVEYLRQADGIDLAKKEQPLRPEDKPQQQPSGEDSDGPSRSEQLKQEITKAYLGALGRQPDAQGLQYYLNQALGGRPMYEITNELFASPEYSIRKCYQRHLLREPDRPGMSYWLKDHAGGQTLTQICNNIRRSDSCRVSCL